MYVYIYSYIFDGKTPSLMETNPPTISIYKLQSMRTTMWGPLVISWFTDTMNYSYLRLINQAVAAGFGFCFAGLAIINLR